MSSGTLYVFGVQERVQGLFRLLRFHLLWFRLLSLFLLLFWLFLIILFGLFSVVAVRVFVIAEVLVFAVLISPLDHLYFLWGIFLLDLSEACLDQLFLLFV